MAQVNPAEKAELLSASISIAMNNTAFALMVVAIPFLLIHSFLQAKTADRRRPRGGQDQLPQPWCSGSGRPGRGARDAPAPGPEQRPCASDACANAAHLEITAFINLIVVLVPFLLSTACSRGSR